MEDEEAFHELDGWKIESCLFQNNEDKMGKFEFEEKSGN
jgi:hypothetical protein